MQRRLLTACSLLVGSIIASSALAGEKTAVVLSAGAGIGSFSQGSAGPPLCCGERDNWSTLGPALLLGAGYALIPWLEPGADFAVARLTGSDGALDISLSKLDFAPRVAFRFGDPIFVAARIGWHFEFVSAKFEGAGFETSTSDLFMGPGLGLAAGYRLSPELALGLDAGAELISAKADASRAFHAGVAVTWFP